MVTTGVFSSILAGGRVVARARSAFIHTLIRFPISAGHQTSERVSDEPMGPY